MLLRVLKLINILHGRAFFLYSPLYHVYKSIVDKDESRLLKRMVGAGDTVLDIGANIGYFTRILARRAGDSGFVHAFEPDPLNYSRLVKNLAGCATAQAHHCAVGAQSGELELFISQDLNVDHRTYPTREQRKALRVKCVAIDDWARTDHASPDIVKIDVQGYEVSVLRGMRNTLESPKLRALVMEYWPYGLIEAGEDPDSIFTMLQNSGFLVKVLKARRLVSVSQVEIERDWGSDYTLVAHRNALDGGRTERL